MDSEILLVVDIVAEKEYLNAFITVMKENRDESIKEVGCLEFSFLQDTETPERFFIVERYKDKKAFQLHKIMPHYKKWKEFEQGSYLSKVNYFVKYV